jgi:hypothetical protein
MADVEQTGDSPRSVKELDVTMQSLDASEVGMKLRLRGDRLSVVIDAPHVKAKDALEAIRHDIAQHIESGGQSLDSLVIKASQEPDPPDTTLPQSQNSDRQAGNSSRTPDRSGPSARRNPSAPESKRQAVAQSRDRRGDIVV